MEEVTDRIQASRSQEELAIHFLLRHAECRSALTGKTGRDRPYDARVPFRADVSATAAQLFAVNLRQSAGHLSGTGAAPAGVADDDSCTARFLRAYAAARHIGADADTPPRVRTAEDSTRGR